MEHTKNEKYSEEARKKRNVFFSFSGRRRCYCFCRMKKEEKKKRFFLTKNSCTLDCFWVTCRWMMEAKKNITRIIPKSSKKQKIKRNAQTKPEK